MNEKKFYWKVGLFVISAAALLLAMLFFFGMSDLFEHKIRVVSCFHDSITGLAPGAEVKIYGVPVGEVTDILLLPDYQVILVEMEIKVDRFVWKDPNRKNWEKNLRNRLKEMVEKHHLCCNQEMTGITGLKIINMKFDDDLEPELSKRPPELAGPDYRDAVYVPGGKFALNNLNSILNNLNTSVDKISRIKFEEISNEIETSLESFTMMLQSRDMKNTLTAIASVAMDLEILTAGMRKIQLENISKQLQVDLNSFNDCAEKVGKMATAIEGEVKALKAAESSASFRDLVEEFREIRLNLNNTMMQINQMLESTRRLTEKIADSPVLR